MPMSATEGGVLVVEDGFGRWLTFALSPAEYERAVADIVTTTGHEVTDWRVEHLDPVEGMDGTYIMDVTARFRIMGADFVILFECKRHYRPVEREDVQVLQDKLRSTGAHKGVVVAASGFQRGALQYVQKHGIACVRLVDGAWTYETRDHNAPAVPQPIRRTARDAVRLGATHRCAGDPVGHDEPLLAGRRPRRSRRGTAGRPRNEP
jgi:restriction system protein